MSWFRRALVLLLVALALPLQAIAAAAMLHCLPADAGRPGGGAEHADPAAGHAHPATHSGAHAALAADHGASPAGHDLADGHVPPAVHGDGHAPVGHGHACSACAVCCTLAGAPAVSLGVPSPERMPAARGEGPPPAAVFLTAGVERPPRG